MDNFQLWLYVIIGIIYVLSKLRKKPEQQDPGIPEMEERNLPRRSESSSPGAPQTGQRQLTFEELLREITEAKEERKPEPVTVKSEAREKYVNYEEEIEAEEEDLEDEGYDYRKKDKLYAEYEDAKALAFYRPSLEETMSLNDTDTRFGRFKEFEQAKERDLMKEYLGDLQDPEGLKKAFVMSEIFQRKF